jgi:hypothetical protein
MRKQMKLLKGIGIGLCLTVLCATAAQKATADPMNHKTIVTFSAPVEVPGVGQHMLPAGTYMFKLLDSPSDRHIVQIFSEDGNHVYTTILAIPNYRLKTTGDTVMTFRERPAGQPEALKAWFYPGQDWGEEFVYERSRAIELAKESNETILSTPVTLADAPAEVLNTAPFEAVSPTGETVDTATVVQLPPAYASAQAKSEPVLMASLPKTASQLPLIGLLGLLALVGGFVLTGFLKYMV